MLFSYKKNAEIHTLGQAGRLNCLNTWWVLPGDSISLNFGGLFRMPNMRKYMWTPIDVKIFCFFTPAAWMFPTFRESLSKQMKDPFGVDGGYSPLYAFNGSPKYTINNLENLFFQWMDGSPKKNEIHAISYFLYNFVFNEWFRDLNLTPSRFVDSFERGGYQSLILNDLNNGTDGFKNYGRPVCNLPDIFSSFNENSDAVDSYYQTDVVADELDLVDLQQQAQTVKSQQEYYHMAQRYRDQLAKKFEGASVSHEADPRPYLLGMHEMEFGGHDIDATGSNIGETQGKSTGRLEFNLPETMFGEHGFLQMYIVPRFRPIYEHATNPLWSMMDNHPRELMAIPEYISQQKPVPVSLSDFFNGGSTADLASIPSGEFLKWGYSHAHRRFHEVEAGFPLLKIPSDMTDIVYCKPDDWNRMFISQALGNYSVQSQYHMNVKSTLPPSSASLMAGTNLGA